MTCFARLVKLLFPDSHSRLRHLWASPIFSPTRGGGSGDENVPSPEEANACPLTREWDGGVSPPRAQPERMTFPSPGRPLVKTRRDGVTEGGCGRGPCDTSFYITQRTLVFPKHSGQFDLVAEESLEKATSKYSLSKRCSSEVSSR